MIIALLLFSAFFVLPILKEATKKKLGEKERTNAPGDFITLSRGVVHYRWLGAEKGDLVVCIHGLTTPSFVFEGLASHYADIGKRVLVYDHYGRGYTDRPTAKQDKTFFINQLDELLNKLEIKRQKFDLVGYSMGGAIAVAYAAHNPNRLNKLILIASAGTGHNLGFSAKVAKIPLFGWVLFSIFFGLQHALSTKKDKDIKSSVPNVVERQLNELLYKYNLCLKLRSQCSVNTPSIMVEWNGVWLGWRAHDSQFGPLTMLRLATPPSFNNPCTRPDG